MARTPSRSRIARSSNQAPVEPLALDGRRARRIRGRLAVLDAVLDLIEESQVPPSIESVSERSGVSQASIFRYFETIDDLQSQAVTHFANRNRDLFVWSPPAPTDPFAVRLAALINQRLDQYETVANMARFARRRALANPYVADRLRQIRSDQRTQIEAFLQVELTALPHPIAQRRVDAILSLLTFESWDQLGNELGRDRSEIFETWSTATTALLHT